MPRKKNTPAPKKTKGRVKGTKLDKPVVLFNRWNLMFYTTIKNDKGKVSGRDYTVHSETVQAKLEADKKAHDTRTIKFLKAVKSDIVRDCVWLMKLGENRDLDTFDERDDKVTDTATLKEETLKALEAYYAKLLIELTGDLGAPKIAADLTTKWKALLTVKKPVGAKKSEREKTISQLGMFSF